MPAYNEQDNIEEVVASWHPVVEKTGADSRLVIFNDGSKDRTYEVMKSLQEKYPFFVAETKENTGHGATCLYAYQYALEHGADYIFQTDSDGQTNPDEFMSFWENRDKYDMVIGQREKRGDGLSRWVISKVLRLVILCTFKVWVRDANVPYRLMKKSLLADILPRIPDRYFLSNVVLSVLAVKSKSKILWLPISFKDRSKGETFWKINVAAMTKVGCKTIADFARMNRMFKKDRII
jgi:glycosyltransferase involved in cell wall biosynthesis